MLYFTHSHLSLFYLMIKCIFNCFFKFEVIKEISNYYYCYYYNSKNFNLEPNFIIKNYLSYVKVIIIYTKLSFNFITIIIIY